LKAGELKSGELKSGELTSGEPPLNNEINTLLTETSDPSFEKGNLFYREGKFAEAAEIYKKLQGKHNDTAVTFNLGNSWFKCWQVEGKNNSNPYLGKAILCYEKVLFADPRNTDAAANLAYAKTFIEDKFIEDGDSNQIFRYLSAIWAFPSVDELEVILVILVWIVVVIFVVRGRTRHELFAEFSFWLLFLLVPLTILTGCWAGARAIEHEGKSEAIVLVDSTDITGSPNLDGTKLFSLHEGTKVSVVRRSSGWVQVSLPNGFSGWVREEKLGFIQLQSRKQQ
jgi:hypothetical protein